MKFAGHERHYLGDTGSENTDTIDYMHARYYNPTLGRFLSVDPVMNVRRNMPTPQRWNRYVYALNNPILRVDTDGRDDRIFVVNTSNAGVFNKAAEARLNAAVTGTRFEGRVQVVGPFATPGQVRSFLGNADSSDMVAIMAHSGSTKEWAPAKGGMMLAENALQVPMTGTTLASWASVGGGPGACMLAGCNSQQLATTVSAGANTTTLGTTANVVSGELGMATAVALGAMAQDQSAQAAAAAASQELKTPANHCSGSIMCNPNEVARVIAVPPQ
jgi:RHS repeat-associated protein